MKPVRAPGTEGYAENAARLLKTWQGLSYFDKPQPVLDLVPTAPSSILDVGAGIGVDAAALAQMGHHVVAVEPTDELRLAGMDLYPSLQIEWIADSLPDLEILRAGDRRFDLIMLSAVWMHLDLPERRQAIPLIAAMIRPGGRMIMSLRHGLVPPGRRMFEVSAAETSRLARAQHLKNILHLEAPSVQQANRQAGVTWTHLAFAKTG